MASESVGFSIILIGILASVAIIAPELASLFSEFTNSVEENYDNRLRFEETSIQIEEARCDAGNLVVETLNNGDRTIDTRNINYLIDGNLQTPSSESIVNDSSSNFLEPTATLLTRFNSCSSNVKVVGPFGVTDSFIDSSSNNSSEYKIDINRSSVPVDVSANSSFDIEIDIANVGGNGSSRNLEISFDRITKNIQSINVSSGTTKTKIVTISTNSTNIGDARQIIAQILRNGDVEDEDREFVDVDSN